MLAIYDIEVQYAGESSWHYYATCHSEKEAAGWVDTLNNQKPGKVWKARIRQEV